MTATTHCYIPILGKRLRVTQLDDCGNVPLPGTANSWIATDGFITLTLATDVEAGAEIITKKADGTLCVNEKLAASFKRFNVDIEFCGVNPSLLGLIGGVKPYLDAELDIAGFTVREQLISDKFALELWTGLSGQGCDPGAEAAGGYLLLPFVNAGELGDIAVTGDKQVTFTIKNAYTKGQNNWGVGPYNVVGNAHATGPAPLPTALDKLDHMLLIDTSVAAPPSACDLQAMYPAVTSISPATGPAAGGTATVIKGGGFTGATGVKFATVSGTSFSVVDDNTIHVTSPAHAAGAVDVNVTLLSTAVATLVAGFLYT